MRVLPLPWLLLSCPPRARHKRVHDDAGDEFEVSVLHFPAHDVAHHTHRGAQKWLVGIKAVSNDGVLAALQAPRGGVCVTCVLAPTGRG